MQIDPLGLWKEILKLKERLKKNTLIKHFERPHVEYALSVWSPYTKQNIDEIEMKQRRAARWVTNDFCPYSSETDMIGKLGWRSLELRHYNARVSMFYKIDHGFVAIPVPSQLEFLTTNKRHHLLAYRQIHTYVSYNYCSFSYDGWYQLNSSFFQILTFLNQGSVWSTLVSLKVQSVSSLFTFLLFFFSFCTITFGLTSLTNTPHHVQITILITFERGFRII